MNYYVQYHNGSVNGLPIAEPLFSATELSIFTRVPFAAKAKGQVFLVVGVGRPRRYYLWETFQIRSVERCSDDEYVVSGSGWQLAPPQRLQGRTFDLFQKACANF